MCGSLSAFARGEKNWRWYSNPGRAVSIYGHNGRIKIVRVTMGPHTIGQAAGLCGGFFVVTQDGAASGNKVFPPQGRYDIESPAGSGRTYMADRLYLENITVFGNRRAQSAKQYLVSHGIDASRIETQSWGEERPMMDGHDESAWSQNRRAEFEVTSGGDNLRRPS